MTCVRVTLQQCFQGFLQIRRNLIPCRGRLGQGLVLQGGLFKGDHRQIPPALFRPHGGVVGTASAVHVARTTQRARITTSEANNKIP